MSYRIAQAAVSSSAAAPANPRPMAWFLLDEGNR